MSNESLLEAENLLTDEIKKQIATDEGFRAFVALSLIKTDKCLVMHTADIKELKDWKNKIIGAWAVMIIGSSLSGAVIGYLIALFVK